MKVNLLEFYYFGCIGDAGHYIFVPTGHKDYRTDVLKTNPWGYKIDGKLCPSGSEVEGKALLNHKDGWTALSFWDRSVDTRGACNSNFLAVGTFSFDEMMKFANEHFPTVMNRFTFPIEQVYE